MEVVSAIAKVVQEIVKAAATARENRERCLDLADRARVVGDIVFLDSSKASTVSSASGYTVRMRKPSLERLKAALDKALELVESQRPGGFGAEVKKLVTSGMTADRFQTVEATITNSVADVGLAELFAASYRARHANTGTGLALSLPPEHHHQSLQFATPSSQQHRTFRCASSLPQHQSSQSATSLSQEHQSVREGRSLRLSPSQQQQPRLRLGESSSQQQQNSQSTTPPLQQGRSLPEGRSLRLLPSQQQQQRRLRLWESSSQQQQNSQSTTPPLQQGRSLPEGRSLRLLPSQQQQQRRLRLGESSWQQQQNSQSTTPPLQQGRSLRRQHPES